MRRGKVVLARRVARHEADSDELTRAIMGGSPPLPFARPEVAPSAPIVTMGSTHGVKDFQRRLPSGV